MCVECAVSEQGVKSMFLWGTGLQIREDWVVEKMTVCELGTSMDALCRLALKPPLSNGYDVRLLRPSAGLVPGVT